MILETITADDLENNKPLQELTKKQRVAFKLNSLFDGLKVPTAANAVTLPEHAKEVCLKALLKGIDDQQLDFIRKCLIINDKERISVAELLEHPYFDEEFKQKFNEDFESM